MCWLGTRTNMIPKLRKMNVSHYYIFLTVHYLVPAKRSFWSRDEIRACQKTAHLLIYCLFLFSHSIETPFVFPGYKYPSGTEMKSLKVLNLGFIFWKAARGSWCVDLFNINLFFSGKSLISRWYVENEKQMIPKFVFYKLKTENIIASASFGQNSTKLLPYFSWMNFLHFLWVLAWQ